MTTERDLTPKQTKAIVALLTCPTITEAANEAGVSKRTLQRWLDDPGFRAELTIREGEALSGITRRLVGLADQAVKSIAEILSDPGLPSLTKLRAAEAVLSNLLKLRDQVDIENRIAKLERTLT